VWDKKLEWPSTNFRQEALDVDYKGQRDRSLSAEIHEKDELIQEMIGYLGIKNIFPKVMEGDDVVAWLCNNIDGDKIIVSTDHDMWQLVCDSVDVYDPFKKIAITPDNFNNVANISIDKFVIYKSIIGDVSDNIKGLSGFGKVRAKNLVDNWTDRLNIITKDQLDQIDKNKKLIDLNYGYTVHAGEEKCYKNQVTALDSHCSDFKAFKLKSQELGLKSVTASFPTWLEIFSNKMSNNINILIERLGLKA
jgi:5'-3' exonuclease